MFIFMLVLLVAVGVAGYFMVKRRDALEMRRFLIWYCFCWPFMGVTLCMFVFPRQRWLEFVEAAIVVVGYGVQYFDARRQRAKTRIEPGGTHVEL